jgi:hypothetical protein
MFVVNSAKVARELCTDTFISLLSLPYIDEDAKLMAGPVSTQIGRSRTFGHERKASLILLSRPLPTMAMELYDNMIILYQISH